VECGGCREELDRIRGGPGGGEAPNDDVLLSGIRTEMERWESDLSRDKAVKSKMSSELAPFLGRHATDQLFRTVSTRGENLLSTVEPVLALFLGCRTASTLIDQIVTHAILRAP
jgi:hypothetical protein